MRITRKHIGLRVLLVATDWRPEFGPEERRIIRVDEGTFIASRGNDAAVALYVRRLWRVVEVLG